MEGSGSGSGPAPFLVKTYEMIDDSSTDEIVSWSSTNNTFIVWNPADFSRLLLPTYFKHNNFSSFIRQLNTYGFRKVHPERWEFANEDFLRDQKHRLKNIHRRKPIHSHTHPPGSLLDPERSTFEEEIDNLSHDKSTIQSDISRFQQHRSVTKLHLQDLQHRLDDMEKRQKYLLNFFDTALQNPAFVQHISRRIDSMDLSAFNKKRRLPQVDAPNTFADNSGMQFANISHQDFADKLTLELSPTVSNINLVSCSAHSSDEDGESPQKMLSEGEPKEVNNTTAALGFVCPKLSSLEPNCEEDDGYISCLLNLTLASSPLQVKRNPCPDRSPEIDCQEIGDLAESKLYANDDRESDAQASSSRNLTDEVVNLDSSTAPVRVNDVFWEQFLTERPGCSDNEDSTSNNKANAYSVVNMDQHTL